MPPCPRVTSRGPFRSIDRSSDVGRVAQAANELFEALRERVNVVVERSVGEHDRRAEVLEVRFDHLALDVGAV